MYIRKGKKTLLELYRCGTMLENRFLRMSYVYDYDKPYLKKGTTPEHFEKLL